MNSRLKEETLDKMSLWEKAYISEIKKRDDQILFLETLIETIRDNGNLSYNGNKHLLAFSDLKDLAIKNYENKRSSTIS